MGKNNLKVEKAVSEDASPIIALAKQEMAPIVQLAWRDGYDWEEWDDNLKEAINDSIMEKVHVYLDPGVSTRKIAAFTWITFEPLSMWIEAFVIDFPFQRRGYGTFILGWLIDNFVKPNKLHAVKLGVQKNNSKAVKFYKKHGFEEESFLDNINTIIMQKTVK
ncbi:MAG: GNAT family N-acetyltransferase [Candidatus Odinarchaeota archaeon]